IFSERQPDTLSCITPPPLDQCQVVLFHLSSTKLLMQLYKCRPVLGKKQYAGSFPVQSMHEFQKPPVRMLGAQLLYHSETYAASSMHGNSGRLVDGNQCIILEQNLECNKTRFAQFLQGRRRSFHHSHRRYANGISRLE